MRKPTGLYPIKRAAQIVSVRLLTSSPVSGRSGFKPKARQYRDPFYLLLVGLTENTLLTGFTAKSSHLVKEFRVMCTQGLDVPLFIFPGRRFTELLPQVLP
jgi:hypothetical protein